MKIRKTLLLPAALLILSVCASCTSAAKKSADYLAYQRDGGSYICKAARGDALYELLLELGETPQLTFRAPETLAGYRFTRSETGIRLYCGDLELSADGSELPERIFGLFSLDPGDFLSASHEKVSGEEITVVNFVNGEVLRLSSEGKPLMLEEGDLTVSVLRREAK